MSAWNPSEHRVTSSFDDWCLVDRDQRVFLHRGLEFSKAAYDRIWKEIADAPGDPDAQLEDAFNAAVDGLWSNDFEWMHLAGVVKDAVTNFEVYLEHAADEILAFQGKRFAERKRSAPWDRLVAFYKLFAVDLCSPEVVEMRTLRHILTHRRGELRTKKQRERFGLDEPLMDSVARLEARGVASRMDSLVEVVRIVDPVAYDHTWGRMKSAAVLALERDPLLPATKKDCWTSS